MGLQPTVKDFMKAGYPAIFLPTIEPEVAEAQVRKAIEVIRGKEPDMLFGKWKITTGLSVGSLTATELQAIAGAKDLVPALKYVEESKSPIVAVFYNVRQFINHFQVIQQLADTIMAARFKGSHIVLIGSFMELPPELKNLITFVDCPLPTKDQITVEFTKLIHPYEEELSLPEDVAEKEILIADAATAAVGLDMMGAENAMSLSMALTGTVDIRVIQSQKEQEVKKSDVLEFIHITETMDNVGGFSALKEWMIKRRRAFTQEARDYGLPYPKGILMVGPGGTGKSLAAKAIASYLHLPLLRLDIGKIFKSLVGESESAIRLALQVVEAVSPCVLWVDEIDKGMAGMKGSGELDSGVTSRVMGTLLTWRQETKSPVVMAATANDVTSIPSMVFRKGRFDEVWATDLPLLSERAEIFPIHLRKRGRNPEDFDIQLLANRTENFVGAEIEGVIEDAMFSAFSEGVEVTTEHILTSINATITQASRSVEELKALRKWSQERARLVSGVDKTEETGTKIRHITPKRRSK